MEKIVVDGNNLKIEDIYNVSYNNYEISLPENKEFWDKIIECRKFLDDYIKEGYPVYGVTTGFGDSCNNHISHKKAELLQEALINFHGIGVGNYFTKEECKAIMLVRLNSNCKGYSALKIETLKLMEELINRDIIPVIPQLGSVGASGDLTPLSYVAAVLMGKRKVFYKGEILDTEFIFKKENIKPVKLQAKEALALMNGSSVMTAIASLCFYHSNKIAMLSDLITAITVEIIGGNELPFREKISHLKNHKGQIDSANFIHGIVDNSERVYKYEELLDKVGRLEKENYKKHNIKIQDRYSIRCSPQINGVLRDTLYFSRNWIENEINSANDNPLIDVEERIIYNSGNFYGGHIGAVCDFLRIALANVSDLSDKQAELIIDGKYNNLTENLTPHLEPHSPLKGLVHGFKAAQISISALRSEIQFLANPVTIHSSPTESLNQDKVSLGTISARKLKEMVDLIYWQFSIHILAILQAIDLIGVENFSLPTKKFYYKLREFTKFVTEDRPLEEEVRQLDSFLKREDIENIIK